MRTRTKRGRWRARSRLLGLGAVGVLTLASTAASAGTTHPVVSDLDSPRGVAVGPAGRVAYTEIDGTVSVLTTKGSNAGRVTELGQVPATSIAPAVAMNGRGETFVLRAGSGSQPPLTGGALFRWTPGQGMRMLADIGAYQAAHPDPDDLEGAPTDSNPFGVAALPDGSALVADAGGNDLLRVSPSGDITTVARIKPRTTPVPEELQEQIGLPPAMPTEGVATSVAVGPDGSYYVGELRGFPGTPGHSQIWRIAPGATDAVCDPAAPHTGPCQRYADGFTSVTDLEATRDGSLYVMELDKASWLAVEQGQPTEGSLIRLAPDGSRTELAAGELVLPGGVGVGKRGQVYVTAPVFGPGALLSIP